MTLHPLLSSRIPTKTSIPLYQPFSLSHHNSCASTPTATAPSTLPSTRIPVLTPLCHCHLLTNSSVPTHSLSLRTLPASLHAYVSATAPGSSPSPARLRARMLSAPLVRRRNVSA